MGPTGKLLNVRQGDRGIENYARDFLGVARQSAMENTCLMIIFWGGLAEPLISRIPYWVPEESLEDYINLALNLSGSAFGVDLAASMNPQSPLQSPLREPTEPTPFREPTEPTPRSHNLLFLYMGLAFLYIFPAFGPRPCSSSVPSLTVL